MARIECYISDGIKEKVSKLAEKKSLSVSKYISQVLANHCEGEETQAVFQKKVMAILCDIYSGTYNPKIENENQEAVIARMLEIKKQCEELESA